MSKRDFWFEGAAGCAVMVFLLGAWATIFTGLARFYRWLGS